MKQRWAPGFAIVELLIIVVIIAVLVAISILSYNGITHSAAVSATKAHLVKVSDEMKLGFLDNQSYPATLSAELTASPNVTAKVVTVGKEPHYTNLTAVQNGTLLSATCQKLIDEGVGNAKNQGGDTKEYVTGCGNWNYNKMQVTGWDTRVWTTPVTIQQLRDYGNSFTTNDAYNKTGHESAVKKFYNQMADTFIRQGGTSPITSFWDYWADEGNGGVFPQPLPEGEIYSYYCVEAQSVNKPTIVWHLTEKGTVSPGGC